jgi:hypothetical protein
MKKQQTNDREREKKHRPAMPSRTEIENPLLRCKEVDAQYEGESAPATTVEERRKKRDEHEIEQPDKRKDVRII